MAGGASGRNGGFLIAGVGPLPQRRARAVRRRAGEGDVRAHARGPARTSYELATELGAGEARAAGGAAARWRCPRRRPSTCAATRRRSPRTASPARSSSARICRRRSGAAGLVGCLTEHDGALHPARWYRLLAEAAEAAGARIYEGTRCGGSGAGAGRRARAGRAAGSVRARHVVVAADGALPALVPEYAGRVRARRLHMVATEPLPPTLDTLVYARWGYEYLQQRPDGRILAGGFSDVDADDSYTDSDAGSPVIWERVEALPARRPRRRGARSATAGPAWSATATTRSRTSARCPGATASTCPAGTPAWATCPASCAGATSPTRSRARRREPLFPATGAMDRDRIRALTSARRRASRSARRASEAMFRRAPPARSPAAWRPPPPPRPLAGLHRARRGRARLGRGRQRVRGLPQRLQRDGPGPRAPGDRRRGERAGCAGDPLRRHHRGRRGGRGGAVAPLRPPALALHELRHRVDDGRDPDRPRGSPAATRS